MGGDAKKVTKVGNYEILDKLGSGAYAEVKLGRHVVTGTKYAIKIFDKDAIDPDDFQTEVKNEVAIMKYLQHRHVVCLEEIINENDTTYLVMELVSGGELFYEIVRQKKLSENVARKYFQQIVDAMCYCHRKGVCHRDLKPENLLLDDDMNVKVTDFGMAKVKEKLVSRDSFLMRTQCGTPKYMAPEVIVRPKTGYNGFKVDVWTCGVILFALHAGYLPFNGDGEKEIFRAIVWNEIKFPPHFSKGLKVLLRGILTKDPHDRLSMEEVRKNPWFLINYEGDLVLEQQAKEMGRTVSSFRCKSAKEVVSKVRTRSAAQSGRLHIDHSSPVSDDDSDEDRLASRSVVRVRASSMCSDDSDNDEESTTIARKPQKSKAPRQPPPGRPSGGIASDVTGDSVSSARHRDKRVSNGRLQSDVEASNNNSDGRSSGVCSRRPSDASSVRPETRQPRGSPGRRSEQERPVKRVSDVHLHYSEAHMRIPEAIPVRRSEGHLAVSPFGNARGEGPRRQPRLKLPETPNGPVAHPQASEDTDIREADTRSPPSLRGKQAWSPKGKEMGFGRLKNKKPDPIKTDPDRHQGKDAKPQKLNHKVEEDGFAKRLTSGDDGPISPQSPQLSPITPTDDDIAEPTSMFRKMLSRDGPTKILSPKTKRGVFSPKLKLHVKTSNATEERSEEDPNVLSKMSSGENVELNPISPRAWIKQAFGSPTGNGKGGFLVDDVQSPGGKCDESLEAAKRQGMIRSVGVRTIANFLQKKK